MLTVPAPRTEAVPAPRYGHADSLLTRCVKCPPWEPRYADVRLDDTDEPVCRQHWLAENAWAR